MQQFDVCRIRSSGNTNLVLILQHEWFSGLETVVVAPLISADKSRPIARINPVCTINGQDYAVALELVSAIRKLPNVTVVASLASSRDAIKRGLDTLFDGF